MKLANAHPIQGNRCGHVIIESSFFTRKVFVSSHSNKQLWIWWPDVYFTLVIWKDKREIQYTKGTPVDIARSIVCIESSSWDQIRQPMISTRITPCSNCLELDWKTISFKKHLSLSYGPFTGFTNYLADSPFGILLGFPEMHSSLFRKIVFRTNEIPERTPHGRAIRSSPDGCLDFSHFLCAARGL